MKKEKIILILIVGLFLLPLSVGAIEDSSNNIIDKLNLVRDNYQLENSQNKEEKLKAKIEKDLSLDENFELTIFCQEENVCRVTLIDKETLEQGEKKINLEYISEDENNSDNNQEVKDEIKEEAIEETKTIKANDNYATVSYQAHVQSYGWQNYVKDGSLAGTMQEWKRLEALKIKVESSYEGNIEYQSYIEGKGWEKSYKKNNEISGTTGQALRIEAIKIRLTGELAEKYDVYYRAYTEKNGWLGWAKTDEIAGTLGFGYRLEALEIKLVEKNTGENTGNSYKEKEVTVNYQTHVQSIGWQDYVQDGTMAGTSNKGLRLEALRIFLTTTGITGNIEYQTYIQKSGWENKWYKNGELSGTTGKALRMEAIKIRLTGELAEKYDVYYRVHSQKYGWLGWAKNGEIAGTINFSYRMEAIEIKLVLKGTGEATGNSYYEKESRIYTDTYVHNRGFQGYVIEPMASGTTGQALQIEGLRLKVTGSLGGGVEYQSYIRNHGWEDSFKSNGAISGNRKDSIDAIRIRLTGELANKYNVYYRVHVQKLGWLDWAKNGENAGTTGLNYRIEAIEVQLYEKNDPAQLELPTFSAFRYKGFFEKDGYTYYYDENGNMANDWIYIDGVKYFFNSLGHMIAKNADKVIDVSYHQGIIDWEKVKREGDIDGVIVRVAGGSAEEDSQLARNVSELKRLGIPFAFYIYSYAENEQEAIWEAERVIRAIQNYNVTLSQPIFLDLESTFNSSEYGPNDYLPIVRAFKKRLTDSGYESKIYTYKYWADTALNTPELRNDIAWVAQYNHHCTYDGNYIGWQYSSTESVPGISGNVDMSVWFTNFS